MHPQVGCEAEVTPSLASVQPFRGGLKCNLGGTIVPSLKESYWAL